MPARFDKHPKLKMIIGHMGEMLPVMLAPLDDISAADVEHLKRKPSRTIIEQVWITTSGIFTQPPFVASLQTFGIDRIMFSVDYPFARDAKAASSSTRSRSRLPTWPSSPRQRGRAAEAEGVRRFSAANAPLGAA